MGQVVSYSVVELETFVGEQSYQCRSNACSGGGKTETVLILRYDTRTEVKKCNAAT